MTALKVLILEDDENLRHLLCETLEDEGYICQQAASGIEAIDKVSSELYDLLIIDVRMEGMSGLDAFAHMRQQGVELACLVITGYATEEDSIRAIRLGVGDYLRKPFEMRELLLRLARISAMHMRQRQSHLREQRLQSQLKWLQQQHFSTTAQQVGLLARQLACGLQLDTLEQLEVEIATATATIAQEPQLQNASDWVYDGLYYFKENWDGSGPLGLAGEAIPLAARIVRLALLASQNNLKPQQLLSHYPGVLDPHLLYALEFPALQNQQQQVSRLLDLARGLISSGQLDQASTALKTAEKLGDVPQSIEVQLLLAELEPPPLRQSRLERLLNLPLTWGSAWKARILTESALVLLPVCPAQASQWLHQAQVLVEDAALQALIKLALWSLGHTAAGPPLEAITLLLQPKHEHYLLRSLPWLALPLLCWWQDSQSASPILYRLARDYAGPLLPALLKLSPVQRRQILELWPKNSQMLPALWLQTLLQESDEQSRRLASHLSHNQVRSHKPPALHLHSFGYFKVMLGGRSLDARLFRGQRNFILLACIAASTHTAEEVIREHFWPEELEKGRKGLYNGLFNIRKALRPEGWKEDCNYILRQHEMLCLEPDLEPWHDLWEVEKGLARLRTLDWPEWRKQLNDILDLTQGVYLEGCYMDWAITRRDTLEMQLGQVITQGCSQALQKQAWDDLLEWSQRLLHRDLTNQKAAINRMCALCQLGRPQDAIKLYEIVTRNLRQDYQEEPTLELVEWLVRAQTWT